MRFPNATVGTAALLLLLMGAALPFRTVYAASIVIEDAATEMRDEVYYLNARVSYTFDGELLDAVQKGLPLIVDLEIEILRHRDYMWDETVTHLEQRYELQFHALTRQYLLRNLNSGSQLALPSLDALESVLGAVVDLPILDANLLDPKEKYTGRLLARVDTDALPVPLRLLSYFSSDWRLSSEWFTWSLQP